MHSSMPDSNSYKGCAKRPDKHAINTSRGSDYLMLSLTSALAIWSDWYVTGNSSAADIKAHCR
jgi:hypothetical protein